MPEGALQYNVFTIKTHKSHMFQHFVRHPQGVNISIFINIDYEWTK